MVVVLVFIMLDRQENKTVLQLAQEKGINGTETLRVLKNHFAVTDTIEPLSSSSSDLFAGLRMSSRQQLSSQSLLPITATHAIGSGLSVLDRPLQQRLSMSMSMPTTSTVRSVSLKCSADLS
jgi:hypothetical protein